MPHCARPALSVSAASGQGERARLSAVCTRAQRKPDTGSVALGVALGVAFDPTAVTVICAAWPALAGFGVTASWSVNDDVAVTGVNALAVAVISAGASVDAPLVGRSAAANPRITIPVRRPEAEKSTSISATK